MQRELRFRLWDKESKRFIFTSGWNYVIDFNGQTYMTNYEGSNLDIFNIYDYVIVTQFTGLRDCDGVEIWEGDILDCTCTGEEDSPCMHYEWVAPVPVYFSTEDNAYISVDKRGWSISLNGSNHYKVIGNKFENPGLLEEAE